MDAERRSPLRGVHRSIAECGKDIELHGGQQHLGGPEGRCGLYDVRRIELGVHVVPSMRARALSRASEDAETWAAVAAPRAHRNAGTAATPAVAIRAGGATVLGDRARWSGGRRGTVPTPARGHEV
jgi:hypothetical protein